MGKRRSRLKRLGAVILPVLAVAVTILGTATAPAQGSVRGPAVEYFPELCGNSGSGYCLNDWNGSIGDVKMYYGGYSNDSFWSEPVVECGDSNLVEGAPNYCPFTSHAIDNHLKGLPIYQFESGVNSGWCLGSASNNSMTILQPCGGTGTVFVGDDFYSCTPGISRYISQYWTNHYNTYEYLESGNALGNQANEDYSGSSPTCWGYHDG